MGAESHPIRIEELLEHAGWVRALARSLVRDAGVAEDLVQETWLEALRRPPGDRRNLRAWLGRVVTHAAQKRGRRAPARPLADDPAGAGEPPEDLAEAVELQQVLARHVLELEEPYRSTVILRYWHDLDSAHIARRQGVPAGTVRWRLKEGLDRLRARLDASHGGDRRAWCLALAPLLRRSTAAGAGAAALPVLWSGILAMPLALKLSLSATVLVLALLGLRALGDDAPVLTGRSAESPPTLVDAREAPPPALESRRPLPPLDATPAEAGESAAPAPERSGRITARVLGADGRPLAAATVASATGGARATSDAEGRVRLDVELERGPAKLVLLFLARGHAQREEEVVARSGETVELGDVALAPGGDVAGRVVDATGAPVAGASVTHAAGAVPAGNLERARREHTLHGGWWRATRTDADGRFTLRGVPIGERHLWADREGYLATPSRSLVIEPGASIQELEIELGALPREDVIAGRVLDGNGAPVAFAPVRFEYRGWLSSGSHSTTTDADGRFSELCERGGARRVRASAPDGNWTDAVRDEVRPGTTDLVLRLGPPRTFALAVVGAGGSEPESTAVVLWDPERTQFLGPRRPLERRADGTLDVPAPGVPFVVVVAAPGHEERALGPFDLASLPERVDCRLAPLPGVRGTVRASGAPVARARVEIAPLAESFIERNGFPVRIDLEGVEGAASDAEGRFRVTLRRSGTFVVRIEAEGFAARELGPLAIDPAVGLDLGTLELDVGGALEGRVLEPDGGSPAGRIVAVSRGDGHARSQRVGADGRYRFERLVPGPWQVELRTREIDPNGAGWSQDGSRPAVEPPSNCVVRAGATTFLDLSTGDGEVCVLSGTLRVDDAPARGWLAELREPGARVSTASANVECDADGRFRLSAATPGKRWLALASGDLLILAEVELVPGSRTFAAAIRRATLDVEGLAPASDERLPAAVHVWTGDGLLAFTPLHPDDAGRVTGLSVPAGQGRIVLAEGLASLADPREILTLPTLLAVELEAGAHGIARIP